MQQRPRDWNEADRDPPCRSQTCSPHGGRDAEDKRDRDTDEYDESLDSDWLCLFGEEPFCELCFLLL